MIKNLADRMNIYKKHNYMITPENVSPLKKDIERFLQVHTGKLDISFHGVRNIINDNEIKLSWISQSQALFKL